MTIRVRFDITWTVNRDMFKGPWFSIEDHIAHAKVLMLESFARYNSAARFQVNPVAGVRDEVRILWDVDMDMVPGAFHEPADHVEALQQHLVGAMGSYDPMLEVQIWRKADFSEAVDHGQIYAHYGASAEQSDFPVFRPEPEATWEAADEVFLQDGFWFWMISEEMSAGKDPFDATGPAAGPAPEAIYTLWDDDVRARQLAAAHLAAERDHRASLVA